ncbi:MAG: serine/threonine-protein kinase, partial [Acidobacteriota bacterium]
MTPDRFARLEALFDASIGRSETGRRALLDRIADDDPELAREAADLLAADAELPTAELDVPARPTGDPLGSGSRLGPYRLDREVWTGGMGKVFLARRHDGAFDARVAIKVLRHTVANSDTTARFRAERQILARLDHPTIARLLDGGTTADGRPWLAMEWIDGSPIDRHADRHRLDVDQRVALVRSLCDAVDHAHRHLLVHRDIKPSNVLVTAEHGVKLLDFGIAKALTTDPATPDLREQTAPGRHFLSLAYSSPEQAAGEPVGVAADVYSTGVLLFELLTGRSPYALDGRASDLRGALARRIATGRRLSLAEGVERVVEDPIRPRVGPDDPRSVAAARGARSPEHLVRRLTGDLDAIVAKALALDPSTRYRSMIELARDLDRWRAGRPVEARPVPLPVHAWRWAGRHRRAAVAWSLALATSAILAIGWIRQIDHQGDRVATERDHARQVADALVDLFDTPSVDHPVARHVSALDLLDTGVRRLDAASAGSLPSPVAAELLTLYAHGYRQLGRARKALDLAHRADRQAISAHGETSVEHARALLAIADAELDLARFASASARADRAVLLLREHFGDEHLEVARAWSRVGRVHAVAGRHAEAEAARRRALHGLRAVEPGGLETAEALTAVARSLTAQGRIDAAGSLLREALDLRRRRFGGDTPEMATGLLAVAETEAGVGRRAPALDLTRRALALRRRHFGDEHPLTLSARTRLADLLRADCNRWPEARAELSEVVSRRRSIHGDQDPTLVD